MSMLLAAVTATSVHSLQLDCLLRGQDEGPAHVTILMGGRKLGKWETVSFEDSDNLLGDDYGGKSANQRKWRIQAEQNGGIRIRSVSRRTGHSAEVSLWPVGGQYDGHYWVNQGMLSETIAFGGSGEINCKTVTSGKTPAGEELAS